MASTTHERITVCHYMVRYPFLHYSYRFFHISLTLDLLFFALLSFGLCLLMLALCSCCILFVVLFFRGAPLSYHTYYRLCFYQVALFSFIYTIFSAACLSDVLLPSYTFYNLLFLHIKFSPCCICFLCSSFFMFHFFHFLIFLLPFSCCTIFIFRFFILHFFHVAFLTVCIIPATLFNVITHSWCAFSCLKSIYFGLFEILALFLVFDHTHFR